MLTKLFAKLSFLISFPVACLLLRIALEKHSHQQAVQAFLHVGVVTGRELALVVVVVLV